MRFQVNKFYKLKSAEEPAMTLQNILLFAAIATVIASLTSIIRFANRTVKIRSIWDSALETNRVSKIR